MFLEFINANPWYLYLVIGAFSLCIGSFLNVVIYRLPLMMQAEWKEQCCEMLQLDMDKHAPINLFYPRSFCPNCKTMVKAWQNLPVISYMLLRGKCHHCKTSISLRYPFIELITCGLSLFAAWHFGITLQLSFALVAIWILIALIFIDLDHQILPDNLTISLLWIGLLANTQSLFTSLPNAVLSAAGAYVFLWLFIQLFYLITGKIGMGNGDFKLYAAFGAWFGWTFLPLILLLSSIAGAIVGAVYLSLSKQSKDTTIPFGPFLCIAGLISMFYGQELINAYLSFWY